MNKIIIFLFTLFISSCYLANGSPSESNYWMKNNRKIAHSEMKLCQEITHKKLGERFLLLLKKFNTNYFELRQNTMEYQEFSNYVVVESKLLSDCYYNLGYRFNAPLYWCLAQDGNNSQICVENMKYRD